MNETARRLLSAAVLVPLYVISFTYSGFFFLQLPVLGAIFVFIGLKEFYGICDKGDEGRPFKGTGLLFALILVLLYYFKFISIQKIVEIPEIMKTISVFLSPGFDLIVPTLFIFFIVIFTLQITKRPLDGAMFSVSTTFLGVLYLAIPFGHFMLYLTFQEGVYYIFAVSGLTFITDAGAYFGGRWFGRHPAGLKISPKKTLEGYVTGIITAALYLYCMNLLWPSITGHKPAFGFMESFGVSIVISIVSVIGDLTESAMKRDAKIKDSSSVIPGHGGTLDLADALLFTLPVLYYYIKFKELAGFSI
ncbi:MAG: phosphatidate cytidylyltransferase [Leptospira sp.]|nr:phosphatidate cytidylyltransferase [Leptospira sp.]